MGIVQSAPADLGTTAATALGSPLKMCTFRAGECQREPARSGQGLRVMEWNGILAIPDSKGKPQGNQPDKALSGSGEANSTLG